MSVDPSEMPSEVWTRWQGHVINSEFRLGRCLGSSDHSGVYLTRSATLAAADLVHPHLLRLLQWGGCQLEGLPYLYVAMEYADQTLAQLLQRRALTEDEARELLAPTLEALSFLHGEDCVQGQLKPANILVVGDQLKLASDTVRRVGEGAISTFASTAFDPPEGRQGSTSPAGDVWALGVTLFEALARRLPAPAAGSGAEVGLPPEFPPPFRAVVVRCLSADPRSRPSLDEIAASTAAKPLDALEQTIEIVPLAPPDPQPCEPPLPAQPEPAPRASIGPAPAAEPPPAGPRRRLLLTLGTVAVAVLVLATIVRMLPSRSGGPVPARPGVAAPLPQAPPARSPSSASPATPPAAVHQVIPEVPAGARRTIRGHIKVWVRVVVEQDGSVLAAVADRSGPSRYFERLAVEAARKWTFPPAESAARRIAQVQFDFSRDGTTARAVTLR